MSWTDSLDFKRQVSVSQLIANLLQGKWIPLLEPSASDSDYKSDLARFNKAWANLALDMCGGNNKKAAELMGISQDTFRKYRDWDGLPVRAPDPSGGVK